MTVLWMDSLVAMADDMEHNDPNPKPLWELGVFTGVARIPHYRGSEEFNLYVLPLPYLIYRGEMIQSDREGVRGIFYRGKHFESNMSVFGNPPVDDSNDAREGMPELDMIFEIGPALKWYITERKAVHTLHAKAALRAVISADVEGPVSLNSEGLNGGLHLIYGNRQPFGSERWRWGSNAALIYSDESFNHYFYDVDQRFATDQRPSYESEGGYGGFGLSTYLTIRTTRNTWVGAYCRWENLNGAVFEDSPLVTEKNNVIWGCAFTWRLSQSEQYVTR
jgi:outer membrane protein